MSDQQDFEVCKQVLEQTAHLQPNKQTKSQFSVCLSSEEYDKLLQLKPQNQALSKQISQLRIRIQKQENQLNLSSEVKKTLQKQILVLNDKLQKQKAQIKQESARHEKDNQNLYMEIKTKQEELENMKIKFRIIFKENSQLRKEIEEKNQDMCELEEQNSTLTLNLESIQKELKHNSELGYKKSADTKQHYENLIKDLEDENQAIVKELSFKIESMALKFSTYTQQNQKLKSIIAEKEDQLSQYEDIKHQLNSQLKQSKNMIHEFKQSIRNYSLQMEAKNLELNECQYKLRRLEGLVNSSGQTQNGVFQKMKQEILQRQTIISIMDTELKGLKIKYQQLNDDMSKKIMMMQSQLRKYEHELNKSRSLVSEVKIKERFKEEMDDDMWN